jgi:hypothetical protein
VKFSIAYMGPEWLFHLRRDFILVLKFSLEDLGHDVVLAGPMVDPSRFNLLIGAYALKAETIHQIAASGAAYAHINTEVIANDMLNHNPEKTDFLGAYLPSMEQGRFVWDLLLDNMPEHESYGTNALFLRWGSHPRMADIEHRANKDLDYYFFGMLSDRRKRLLQSLKAAGLVGTADHSCPYFLRNDRIARAKVQLNLIQDDKYAHVNAFRICYLADNACCVLTEREHDPANYLKYTEVVDANNLAGAVREYASGSRWKERGEAAKSDFAEHAMNAVMEELLDRSFAPA